MAWWVKAKPTEWLAKHFSVETRGPFDTEDEARDAQMDILDSFDKDNSSITDEEEYATIEKENDAVERLVQFEIWNDEDKEGTLYYSSVD